ncbi:hypothetical protein J7E63_26680 [Bacillus sp. ISL-75]|uniref:hypothetical protein n=1 Tax=Bacillus sp. ISL-75 TaxID=2819137 RepID=UPI001BE98099|nr:hypothetical protein [Bacillus sp. ISL-75]MBT2730420.1 hypothetical protein [Bacillus sp. ISL-75]
MKIKMGEYSLGWNLDNIQDAQVIQDKVSISGYDKFTDNDKKRTLQKITSSVTYSDVMPNTDLQYKLISHNNQAASSNPTYPFPGRGHSEGQYQ